jgi:RNA polymerase sigma-70 factor (ECF subfamily)
MEADATVVERILTGEKDAYEVIVKKYQARAYRAALGWVGNSADALDMSQEAFIKAYRSLRRYDRGRSFFAWFYVILRNTCFNFLRKRKRARTVCLDYVPERMVATEDEGRRAEVKRQVWRAIAALPDGIREVMVLKYFEEMSYREIADAVGCPIGTVMSRLYYGRKKLKQALEGYHV